jgi:hypothetical protein
VATGDRADGSGPAARQRSRARDGVNGGVRAHGDATLAGRTKFVAGQCQALGQSRRRWPGASPRAVEQSLSAHRHRADSGAGRRGADSAGSSGVRRWPLSGGGGNDVGSRGGGGGTKKEFKVECTVRRVGREK